MDLVEELAEFDGKHTNVLEDIASRYEPTPAVLTQLLKSCEAEDLRMQAAASWVLKRFLEGGASLRPAAVFSVIDLIAAAGGWEPRLHLLQLLSYLEIPKDGAKTLAKILRAGINDENKLVRAWAYHGLYVLADQHPAYRRGVEKNLRDVSEDEAASVKARLRNIVKTAEWL